MIILVYSVLFFAVGISFIYLENQLIQINKRVDALEKALDCKGQGD